MNNKEYTVTLSKIPANLAELKAMPEGALEEPQYTAALTVAAFCVYPKDKEACFEMLTYLSGPRGLSVMDNLRKRLYWISLGTDIKIRAIAFGVLNFDTV